MFFDGKRKTMVEKSQGNNIRRWKTIEKTLSTEPDLLGNTFLFKKNYLALIPTKQHQTPNIQKQQSEFCL